ncbi:MAG: type II secretion system F family protein [Candidatus Hydrogenedentes bacterium]|nr:type II secretion system F family protein [Candidatus Hydrogenedentota bacterium]
MPTFAYVARSRDGKKQSGTLTADSRQAVTQLLAQRGLSAEQIQERTAGKDGAVGRGGPKVKTVEILLFTRQLSTIVNAGLPLLQGLDILGEQTEDERFARVIQQIGQDVESGETFSDSLRKHPRVFPDLYVSMVRAGEAGGDLDGVLLQLADYLEASEELKRRIKSAMTYPVVAFSMIVLIAAGLIIFVVPQFATIFESFGKQLPLPTRILLGISEALRSWTAILVAAAAVGAFIGVRFYAETPVGRLQLDHIKLRMPVFGKLLRKVAISRFARTLSTLTRSGVAILAALEIVERTSGNEVFARANALGAGDRPREQP